MPATGLVNHFYFYCVDSDFGPFFLKFCSYFPYNAKLCVNGNHWAQRQAAKTGIGFTAGQRVRRGRRPGRAADDLRQLGPAQIEALLRKWLAILPHPFTTADRAAGYHYELSILQAEFSLTQMLDKPVPDGCSSSRSSATTSIRPPGPGRPDLRPQADTPGPRPTPGCFATG